MNNIIKNGSTVTISNGEIKGLVTACNIRGIEPNVRIAYEVSWFVGGAYHSQYLEDFEVELHIDTKKKAGLVNYERSVEVVK